MIVKINKLTASYKGYGLWRDFWKTIDYIICEDLNQAEAWKDLHYPETDNDIYKMEVI